MTAPRRRSGMLVEHIERGCENKVRFPDELEAKAAGLYYMQHSGGHMQWVYPCEVCKGFHLTRNDNGPHRRIDR